MGGRRRYVSIYIDTGGAASPKGGHDDEQQQRAPNTKTTSHVQRVRPSTENTSRHAECETSNAGICASTRIEKRGGGLGLQLIRLRTWVGGECRNAYQLTAVTTELLCGPCKTHASCTLLTCGMKQIKHWRQVYRNMHATSLHCR